MATIREAEDLEAYHLRALYEELCLTAQLTSADDTLDLTMEARPQRLGMLEELERRGLLIRLAAEPRRVYRVRKPQ